MKNFGKIITNKNQMDIFKVKVINETHPFKCVNKTICCKSITNKEKRDVFIFPSLVEKRPKAGP